MSVDDGQSVFVTFGSQGSDRRFSMKMMFATYLRP